jgi:perosamine synthetase
MATYLNEHLDGISGIKTPTLPSKRERVYLYYNLRLDDRNSQAALAEHLNKHGVPSRVTYEPVHLNSYYREEYGWSLDDLPVTEDIAGRVLTLPFHLHLNENNLNYLINTVRKFFEPSSSN